MIPWGRVEMLRVGEYCQAACQCTHRGGLYSQCEYDCRFPEVDDEDDDDQGEDGE